MSDLEQDETRVSLEPIVLVNAADPERKPRLYACAKCGRLSSPLIYACTEALAHETARNAARDCYNCKTTSTCGDCGAACEKLYTVCAPCRRKRAIAKAEMVPASAIEECFGLDSGGFYNSPIEAEEAGEEYVFAATHRKYSAPDVLDMILEDHHEDADASELRGYDKLEAAIREFNAAQVYGTYDEDRARIARLSDIPS